MGVELAPEMGEERLSDRRQRTAAVGGNEDWPLQAEAGDLQRVQAAGFDLLSNGQLRQHRDALPLGNCLLDCLVGAEFQSDRQPRATFVACGYEPPLQAGARTRPLLPQNERLTSEFIERHLLAPTPGVCRTDHDDEPIRCELVEVEVRGVGLPADQGEMNPTALQKLKHRASVAPFHTDADLRVPLAERGDDRRQKVVARDRAGRQMQLAAGIGTHAADRGAGLAVQGEDTASIGMKLPAGVGERCSPRFAPEEGSIERLFQLCDSLTNGRLGQTEGTSGGGEAAALGSLGECLQVWKLVVVHVAGIVAR
jgi:hypothetical protein